MFDHRTGKRGLSDITETVHALDTELIFRERKRAKVRRQATIDPKRARKLQKQARRTNR